MTAAFAESASPAPGSSGGLPGDPTKGGQVFGQNCASCHGSNLEGGIGPKLNPIQRLGNTPNPLDPNYLINTITNGLNGVGSGSPATTPCAGKASVKTCWAGNPGTRRSTSSNWPLLTATAA